MKIKTETITFSIWCVILFSRILISQDSSVISSPLKMYYISSVLLIVFIFFQWIRNSKKLRPSPILFWGSAFGVYVILFGKILVNNSLKGLTEFTFNALVIFYVLVFIMASYIKDSKCRKVTFVKTTFWTFTIGMIFSAALNWDGKLALGELVSNVFGGYTRTRAAFGFYHPNAAANIALCVIVLSSYLVCENRKKNIYLIIDVFMMYIILATASRTTLSALILFIVLLMYSRLINKIKSNNGKRGLIVGLILIVMLLLLFSGENGIAGLFTLSNRSYNFIYNVPVLVKSGRLWIGLGLIGSGEFYQLPQYNTFFVDNYFLYVLMSTGILGLIFMSCFMIYTLKKLINQSNNNLFERLTLIVFGINIFSCLGETCFMYPSFASCFAFTVLYIACASSKEQNEIEKCEGSTV